MWNSTFLMPKLITHSGWNLLSFYFYIYVLNFFMLGWDCNILESWFRQRDNFQKARIFNKRCQRGKPRGTVVSLQSPSWTRHWEEHGKMNEALSLVVFFYFVTSTESKLSASLTNWNHFELVWLFAGTKISRIVSSWVKTSFSDSLLPRVSWP